MSLVLKNWIPQLVFMTENVLSPIFTIVATLYPTLIVFGFDYKNAVFGHYHVVDLRSMSVTADKKVVDDLILVRG